MDGTFIVKVAMPWIIRRTPFDGIVGPAQRDPLIRYVYSSIIERKAFVMEVLGGEEEEFDQIIHTLYRKNDIIVASKNVVGFGDQDVVDSNGRPVIFLDTNRSSRFWFQNEDTE